MLRELNYVFQRTYVSRSMVRKFLTDIVGQFSREFWQSSRILDIQQNGRSQSEINELVGEILKSKYSLDIEPGKYADGNLIYFDDAIFTGNRVIQDLGKIIQNSSQAERIYIIVIAIHSSAEHWITQKFANVDVRPNRRFENRRSWHNEIGEKAPTDVLRPSEELNRRQSERASRIFSNIEGRQLLEREFLRAGEKIVGFSKKKIQNLKPLGYSNYDPGFGSLFVTYRNCPNNCPLALWFGDPSYQENDPFHPFGKWYPLFPRNTHIS